MRCCRCTASARFFRARRGPDPSSERHGQNKGFKVCYAQWAENKSSNKGEKVLFPTVQFRNMKGEQREIFGEGITFNADQFFTMLTHIPNLVDVLRRDMAVDIPPHIAKLAMLLSSNDDAASDGAGSAGGGAGAGSQE